MPRQNRGRSAPEDEDDAMELEIASDDDDAPMDDDRHAQTLLAWLEKHSLCRAYIVNRLGLALDWDETLQARKLGFLQQEWFCAMRDASNQLQENLYTPQNTLEMRLYELISFRGLGRMRRILTEVKNADGKWERTRRGRTSAPPQKHHPALLAQLDCARPACSPFPLVQWHPEETGAAACCWPGIEWWQPRRREARTTLTAQRGRDGRPASAASRGARARPSRSVPA